MLFAKLFGGRRQEEPADPSPPPVQPRVMPPARPKAVATPAAPGAPKPAAPNLQIRNQQPAGAAPGKDESRGFDPYNSGAFNKSRAWERINRR